MQQHYYQIRCKTETVSWLYSAGKVYTYAGSLTAMLYIKLTFKCCCELVPYRYQIDNDLEEYFDERGFKHMRRKAKVYDNTAKRYLSKEEITALKEEYTPPTAQEAHERLLDAFKGVNH